MWEINFLKTGLHRMGGWIDAIIISDIDGDDQIEY